MPARFSLDLADRFAIFGYGPVVRRKPFGPHLTVGALSCAIGYKTCRGQGADEEDGP
jgi:hypothetical protein